jgi:hypothetical protein
MGWVFRARVYDAHNSSWIEINIEIVRYLKPGQALYFDTYFSIISVTINPSFLSHLNKIHISFNPRRLIGNFFTIVIKHDNTRMTV